MDAQDDSHRMGRVTEPTDEKARAAKSSGRDLGAIHVAAVVVGAIIGVGIFFTPATLARSLPSAAWILGIWLLGGVASLATSLVYAELGGRFPSAGGIYVFLRDGFGSRLGPPLAFLYGWLQLLVVQPGSMAVIAVVLVNHIAYLTGPLPDQIRNLLAVLAIAFFTAANLLGLKVGGRIQIGAAILKIGALAVIVTIGVAFGHVALLREPARTVPTSTIPAFLIAGLIPVLFSFGGAYHGTYIAGSVRNPERAVPRGIMAGIVIVLVGYVGVNVAYLGLLGRDGLARSSSPAAEVAALALGPLAGKALAVIIILSAAGILNTICLGFPFVIYAMARDGLFFERAGRLDPRTGRPRLAVLVQGAIACVAVVVGASRVDLLLTGIAFADALFQGLVAVVHWRVRAEPAHKSILRAPRIATLVCLVVELGLAVGCLINKPQESAYGALALGSGVLVWVFWKGRA